MKRATKPLSRKIRWSTVERPGDVGLDLPAGASARTLAPTDYHPVDMEHPEKELGVRAARKRPARTRRAHPV